MYIATVTKKGTISLPAAIRRKYNIHPGDTVRIEDGDVLRVVISEPIEALRARNAIRLARLPKKPHGPYKNGDGWASYVMEKYGKKSKAVIKRARENAAKLRG